MTKPQVTDLGLVCCLDLSRPACHSHAITSLTGRQVVAVTLVRITSPVRPRPGRGSVTAPKPQPDEDVAQPPFEQVAEPAKPTAERSGQLGATYEQVVEIGRTAPLGRGGRVSRRRMEEAVRAKGLGAGKDLLERAKKDLPTCGHPKRRGAAVVSRPAHIRRLVRRTISTPSSPTTDGSRNRSPRSRRSKLSAKTLHPVGEARLGRCRPWGGVADRSQGAPVRHAATEGGPQPGIGPHPDASARRIGR
ncbi:hypothetical protein BX286_3535 [Streptomyces sp. 3211.6]|nr:hypothetical protein BX286_3535 [Streptomyces sp. 3211.6]